MKQENAQIFLNINIMWNLYILGYLFLLTLTIEVDSSVHKKFYDTRQASKLFSDFVSEFGKKYTEIQYNHRLKIFTQNLEYINRKNKENDDVEYGVNQFADTSKREWKGNLALGRIAANRSLKSKFADHRTVSENPVFCGTVPDQWDWRNHKVVRPPKDQGSCSSCWAFATTGAIETIHAIKYNKLISLSAQQLVDCTEGSDCVDGGLPHEAINQVAANYDGGIASESDYPYEEGDRTCRAGSKEKPVQVVEAIEYYLSNEEYLKALVYNKGPIILGMQIGQAFNFYFSGIGSDSTFGCVKNNPLAHAILAVGYGVESGKPYWIMKNSHGTGWGENGYFRMARGQNTCSILSYVVGAVVK